MDLPERPKLRPLEFIPVERDGRRFIYVKDPFGMVPQGLFLSERAIQVASLMDGESTIDDIQYALLKRFGTLVLRDEIESLVREFDESLLLEGERFEKAFIREKERFGSMKVRPPILAGFSYPDDPSQLEAFVDGIVEEWDGSIQIPGRPVGVVVPHLEIRLARDGYASSYGVLRDLDGVECIVVLGTGHFLIDSPISITTKDFLTPIGVLENMRDITEGLAERFKWAFDAEIFHRMEHSIEVQAIFIKRLFKDAKIVPVLSGFDVASSHEAFWQEFADALLEAVPENALFIASVDLSHMGPRYGDGRPLDLVDLSFMREGDEKLIEDLCSTDVESYLERFRADGNRRRVCGFSPLLLMMRMVKGRKGTLLLYDRREVDGMGSYVSFTSIVYT